MKFLDKIATEFENEIKHIEERIASGIAYNFNKQLPIWEDERNFLRALLIRINKTNYTLSENSEDSKCQE